MLCTVNFNICGRFQVTLVSPYPVQLKCVNTSVISKLLYCLHAAGFNATASKKLDAVHCRVAACGSQTFFHKRELSQMTQVQKFLLQLALCVLARSCFKGKCYISTGWPCFRMIAPADKSFLNLVMFSL